MTEQMMNVLKIKESPRPQNKFVAQAAHCLAESMFESNRGSDFSPQFLKGIAIEREENIYQFRFGSEDAYPIVTNGFGQFEPQDYYNGSNLQFIPNYRFNTFNNSGYKKYFPRRNKAKTYYSCF
jgi:hypothetical protein